MSNPPPGSGFALTDAARPAAYLVKLIDRLEDAARRYAITEFHEDYSKEEEEREKKGLEEARAALYQALTVPQPSEVSEDFLSVRDEFAKAAMQGEFSSLADPQVTGIGDPAKLADRAYAIADAMMVERAKRAPDMEGK